MYVAPEAHNVSCALGLRHRMSSSQTSAITVRNRYYVVSEAEIVSIERVLKEQMMVQRSFDVRYVCAALHWRGFQPVERNRDGAERCWTTIVEISRLPIRPIALPWTPASRAAARSGDRPASPREKMCRTVGCGGCKYGIPRRVCMFFYCFSIMAQLISRSLRDTISNTV
jgi:hypothetical protein